MNWILRNILVFIVGLVAFHFTNLGLMSLIMKLIPPPEGYVVMEPNFSLLGPVDFLVPFIAHAGGTFAGAYIVSGWAATWNKGFALVIGSLAFLGGLAVAFMFKLPIWVIFVDLILCYFPCALLAHKLGYKNDGKN